MNYKTYNKLAFAESCEIRIVQNRMLHKHLHELMRTSQFYQKLLNNIDIEDITVDNLHKLPTTSKHDIEEYSRELITCSKDNIAEIVRSSGTSGKPTKIVYTHKDLKRLKYNEHQALTCCGIRKSDTVLLTCTIDRCFIAGLAYFLGAQSIGAATIRNGANSLQSHLDIIWDLKPNVIIGVPSFLLKLAKFAAEAAEPSEMGIEKLVCIGEPLRLWENGKLRTTQLCTKIEALWGAKAFSTYASTEMVTSFCECSAQEGGHLIPELAIVEVLDEQGAPVQPGQAGEVTVTPFHFDAMPLLRYRTGDIAVLIDTPCKCGRNSVRISGISGRKYQMIKHKGTTFYPPAVNAVLDALPYVEEYQLRVESHELSDNVLLAVALKNSAKIAEIQSNLNAALRVKIDIIEEKLDELSKKVFPPGARKPVRFIMR